MSSYKTLSDEYDGRIGNDYDGDIFNVEEYATGYKKNTGVTVNDISIGKQNNSITNINYFASKPKCQLNYSTKCNICSRGLDKFGVLGGSKICRLCQDLKYNANINKNIDLSMKKELILPPPKLPKQQSKKTDKLFDEFINKDQLITDEIVREMTYYNEHNYDYLEKEEILNEDPEALQWQYKFVNPFDVPSAYRVNESFKQYNDQFYYDNNSSANGDFPERYAFIGKPMPVTRTVTNHKLLTL